MGLERGTTLTNPREKSGGKDPEPQALQKKEGGVGSEKIKRGGNIRPSTKTSGVSHNTKESRKASLDLVEGKKKKKLRIKVGDWKKKKTALKGEKVGSEKRNDWEKDSSMYREKGGGS